MPKEIVVVGLKGLVRVAKVGITLTAQKPKNTPRKIFLPGGKYIEQRREELHINRQKAWRILGVTHSTLCIWENDKNTPHPSQIPKIISFLGFIPPELRQNTLARRIASHRLINGLTQDMLDNLIDVNPLDFHRWENGLLEPNSSQLEQLEDLFATTFRG